MRLGVKRPLQAAEIEIYLHFWILPDLETRAESQNLYPQMTQIKLFSICVHLPHLRISSRQPQPRPHTTLG
jgi:hypothetical protein